MSASVASPEFSWLSDSTSTLIASARRPSTARTGPNAREPSAHNAPAHSLTLSWRAVLMRSRATVL
jgi:hypothetical protein